jgi:hypothetical protein
MGQAPAANYGQLHSVRDEYGDLVLTAQKPFVPASRFSAPHAGTKNAFPDSGANISSR